MFNLRSLIVLIAFAIVAYATSSTTLEIIAALTGLICVWLNAKENIWNYPVGFINVACFAWMFYGVQLYADMMLQGFFAILMVIGWYTWLTKREGNKVRPTTSLSTRQFSKYILLIAVFGFVWAYVLDIFTNASIPYIDAMVAAASIVAQLLLSRKILQSWIIWIAVDVVSIAMYWYKDLHMISFLYAVFLLIAIEGWLTWRRNYEIRHASR